MKTPTSTTITAVALSLLISTPFIQADTFTGFNIDFVPIGDTGNTADSTGYGAVGYNYRIGKHEVSRGMISSYNTNSSGPSLTMQDMTAYGGNGANRPVTGVSWNEAARFVNWLNTSQGYQAAYKFTTGGGNDNIALWSSSNAWQVGGQNLYRHKDAHYFLPSENEWYKAAYYDSTSDTYFQYATGSNSAPTSVTSGTSPNTAVYNLSEFQGPADITQAGGLSPYGTMAQSGNVIELIESAYTQPNSSISEDRVERDGYWEEPSSQIDSTSRNDPSPNGQFDHHTNGFRIASVPEPSSTALLGLGGLALILRRNRTS